MHLPLPLAILLCTDALASEALASESRASEPRASEPAVEADPAEGEGEGDAAADELTALRDQLAAAIARAETAEQAADGVRAQAEADRALLDGLLALLGEDGGSGAEALGALGDARAVPALRQAVRTRGTAVSLPATRALARFPEAGPDLLRWIQDPTRPEVVRVAAAQGAASLGLPEGPDAILATLAERGTSEDLSEKLRAVLRLGWPNRAPEAQRVVARRGTGWMTAGHAVGMGFALGATGHYGQGGGLAAVGGLTGAVGGASLGVVLGQRQPEPAGPAAFYATTGVAGISSGLLLAGGISDGDADATLAGGLVGGALGYGVGLTQRSRYPGSPEDAALGSGVGLGGALLLTGVGDLARSDGRTKAALAGVGLGVGHSVGQLTAPRMGADQRDAGLGVLTTAYGAFAGLTAPVSTEVQDGLVLTGIATGALTAYGLAPVVDPASDVVGGAGAGLLYGGFAAAGIGQLASGNADQTSRTSALVGGTVGAAVGGLLAHRVEGGLQTDDAVLAATTTAWATWQAAGWAAVGNAPDDLQGLLFLVPATTGGLTAIASPRLQADAPSTLAATSLGLWGGYLGAAAGELADLEGDGTLALALALSDVGLGAGALVMSPVIGAEPVVVGVADAGGVLGGSVAALGTALFTGDADAILAASLVGAAGGAAGGAVLGGKLQKRPTAALRLPGLPHSPPLQVGPTFLPTESGGAWGARLSASGW